MALSGDTLPNEAQRDNNSFKFFGVKDLEAFQAKARENVKHFLQSKDARGKGHPEPVPGKRKRKRKPRNNKFKGWPAKAGRDRRISECSDGSVKSQDLSISKLGTDCEQVTDAVSSPIDGKGSIITNNKSRKRKSEERGDIGRLETMKSDDRTEGETKSQKTPVSIGVKSIKNVDNLISVGGNDIDSTREQMGTIYAVAKRKKKRDLPPGNPRAHWDHQLRGARFRFINETFYKSTGEEAFRKFGRDRSAFEAYFEGYNQQVKEWPENPVDVIIKYLNSSPQTWTVGDFGCGEAKIAESVKQRVHSFDMFPTNKHVTVCNISKVPLKSDSLDVAVFCLSLMGTNWTDYLREAHRVLRKGGILKIAEVASRFKSVGLFLQVLNKLGFTLKNKNLTNKMFYLFDFAKTKQCGHVKASLTNILKPCEYKRR